ncbi:MAG: hypothetical protein GC164_02410 [Phycisphaera sp.]|nr:hypothetical protein [Phycisphaera sp.]
MTAQPPRYPLTRHIAIAVILIGALWSGVAAADDAPAPNATGDELVTLNFPDNMEVQALAEYVGKRLGINFIYDEQITGRRITIKTNEPIPVSSLMTLLDSAMKIKGLVIVPTEVPGMMRVTQLTSLVAASAGPGQDNTVKGQERLASAVTRVIRLKNTTTQRIEQLIGPFLSGPNANVISMADLGTMVITDYASNMVGIEKMIALADQPGKPPEMRFVPVVNLSVGDAQKRLNDLLSAQVKAKGNTPEAQALLPTVTTDDRTNRLVLIGKEEQIENALGLLRSIDINLNLQTRAYAVKSVGAQQIDDAIKRTLGETVVDRLYKSVVVRESNMLIVTATPEILERTQAVVESMDAPRSESQSPIRFYKLQNAKATDVLSTLSSIEGQSGLGSVSVDGVTAQGLAPQSRGNTDANRDTVYAGPTQQNVTPGLTQPGNDSGHSQTGGSVTLPDARLIADKESNTIIIIAEPERQVLYEKLIKRLDVRRPQVLIEATVVVLDTTDGFSLGVEISSNEKVNGSKGKVLNFSSFGLSTVDAGTGELTIKPGLGFNGTLVSADIANIVIRALESDTHAKVVSRPSVLVNDNAVGELISEREEPYATTNASGVAGATTSFGGFASAGTRIKITPQISEGDHLKLDYSITLSSFTEATTTADTPLPPARQTNSLASIATIPDGYTIIVGGLTRETLSDAVDRVPFLGRVPLLEYLFSSRSNSKTKQTLFVFIRAVILRDDEFADLKVLSGTAAGQAGVVGDFPQSSPVSIK